MLLVLRVTATVGLAIGIGVGAFLIERYRIALKGYILIGCLGTLAFGLFSIIFLFIGCPNKHFGGRFDAYGNELWNFSTSCNVECQCLETLRFAPICSAGVNYYTPCHAGCSGIGNLTDSGQQTFADCSCVSSSLHTNDDLANSVSAVAVNGFCAEDCTDKLYGYLVLLFFAILCAGPAAVSSILISLRCVSPEEKPLSLGLSSFLYSVFAFIPAPIVIGALIDSSCTYWSKDACGAIGACWLYDNASLRHIVYGSNAVIKFISFPLWCLALWQCPGPLAERGDAASPSAPLHADTSRAELVEPRDGGHANPTFTSDHTGEGQLSAAATNTNLKIQFETGI